MAQAGIIKTITGIVNARTSDGQVRQLTAGDKVYENEIIETTAGSKVTIELNDGKTLAMAENDLIALDETVLAAVDAQDAVVTEVDALQAALEAGEEIPEDELAAGAEDEGHDYDLAYYAGDQSGGEVGSRLTPTEYGSEDEIFPDIDGEEGIAPSLSAIGVVVDETDIKTANTATGTITADYGTAEGGPLALSAAGATWDAASNTLTYQQEGTDIWQIILDQNTGEFTFEQLAAFDHGPDGNDHNALEQFGVTVTATNSFGNSATTTFTAGIYDDGPSITPTIVESEGDDSDDDISTSTTTADPSEHLSVEGDETDGFVGKYVSAEELGIDFGTDGPGSVALSMDPDDPNWEWDGQDNILSYYQGDGSGGREVAWQMELQQEGASVDTWNFTHDGGPLTINMLSEKLGAIIDGDGETSDLDIHIRLLDENGIEVNYLGQDNDDDDSLLDPAKGGADGSVHDYDSYLEFASGALAAGNYTLHVSAYYFDSADPSGDINPDGYSQGDYQVTFTGGVTVDTDDGTIVSQGGGEIVGQGTIQASPQYGYYFEQVNPINHPDTSDHDETATWNVNLTVTDSDTDTAGAVITVAINDDGPTIEYSEFSITGDESAAKGGLVTAVTFTTDDLGIDFGTDGPGSVALAMSVNNVPEENYRWDDISQTLTFYQDGFASGDETWTIERQPDGKYLFTQKEAIDHNPPQGLPGDGSNDSHDEPFSWTVNVAVTDGDNDPAETEFYITINDSGPVIGKSQTISRELGAPDAPDNVIGVVNGVVNGVVDGAFDTDGRGGFYLWDGNARQESMLVEEESTGNTVGEIFMNTSTGEWTFHQFQSIITGIEDNEPMNLEELDFSFQIYDGDGDWADSSFTVPLSQFIVGSDPQFKGEGEGQDPYRDDVEQYVERDEHEEPSPTTGETRGAIIGQDAADVLVGDMGSAVEVSFDRNYIVTMDISDSMKVDDDGDPNLQSPTRLDHLKDAAKQMIENFEQKVADSIDGKVRINLLPFATLPHEHAWIEFDKSSGILITSTSGNVGDTDPLTDDIDEINDWIDGLQVPTVPYFARTSYQAAFVGTKALENGSPDIDNHVIFISDGNPSPSIEGPTDHQDELGLLDVESIRVIGITTDSLSMPIMENIDSTGQPVGIDDTSMLTKVIGEIITEVGPVGSDEIMGGLGNDLIFGDVLNTDGVYDDLEDKGYFDGLEGSQYDDLFAIKDLDTGSGWEVFAELESELPGWTREDTIRYIQENHVDLAKETTIYEDGREGGHDYIEGGEGDDIIYGQEGDDTIDGGTGDDIIDGGTGYDTLMVDSADEGTGGVLDFSNVDNIELINLNDSGVVQNVEISLNDVFDMTDDNHVLQITGEGTDTVFLTGVGTAAGDWEQDGTDPNSFTQIVAGDLPGFATGPTVTIADLNDTIDIHVDVDNGGTSFDV